MAKKSYSSRLDSMVQDFTNGNKKEVLPDEKKAVSPKESAAEKKPVSTETEKVLTQTLNTKSEKNTRAKTKTSREKTAEERIAELERELANTKAKSEPLSKALNCLISATTSQRLESLQEKETKIKSKIYPANKKKISRNTLVNEALIYYLNEMEQKSDAQLETMIRENPSYKS